MNTSVIQDKMVQSNRVLYTPSTFAKNNLFYAQEIGTLQALALHTSKRSQLASYLFFCVKSGAGMLTYDNVSYSLSAGDCVFLDCNKAYSHTTSEHLWCLQWIHFDGPNMNKIYDRFFSENNSPVFRVSHIQPYENLLTEIQNITLNKEAVRDMLICEKITGLLAQIVMDCNHSTIDVPAEKTNTIKNIKSYLDENFQKKISLDELSKLFYIDKYYLSRRFKQCYGSTVISYLQQVRITHAKHLLRFSALSIEEIAYECGTDDANYFARLFKKVEGISPSDFRRSWSGST